jgi:serine protease AprX
MRKIITLFSIFLMSGLWGHSQVAPQKYFVAFRDKSGTPYSISSPEAFLSARSIQRRISQNIAVIDQDLPVNPVYVDAVRSLGVTVLTKSKWFNGITIFTTDNSVIASIEALPFVLSVVKNIPVKRNSMPGEENKFTMEENSLAPDPDPPFKVATLPGSYAYGQAWSQVHMVNVDALHNQGFSGQGKVIAILDAGFLYADTISGFDSLRANGQILGTRDFVKPGNDVYREYPHGMEVLSIIGGNIPGKLVGTAPKASFWLLRSEDANSENIIEEYNWVSAAEFADSVGADIINSSLGYTTFDDSTMNHTCADMNGNTTPCTRGANICATKGIAVINSAGNSGGSSWRCVGAPADGFNVLAIGAVDSLGNYAGFSSVGKVAGTYVKPNVTAMGQRTAVISPLGTVMRGSGTSFSSPVIAGAAACLWQSRPGVTNFRLYEGIEASASKFDDPDTLMGYGIPDFSKAFNILSLPRRTSFLSSIYPNPFNDHLVVTFRSETNQDIRITIFDIMGKVVYSGEILTGRAGENKIEINDLGSLSKGFYLLRITDKFSTESKSLIKTN